MNTIKVPVDPIQTSKRGWFNILITVLGALIAVPDVQTLVQQNPKLAALVPVVSGIINYILLYLAKKNVVSKNVLAPAASK